MGEWAWLFNMHSHFFAFFSMLLASQSCCIFIPQLDMLFFFMQAHDSAPAGPKIVFVPLQSIFFVRAHLKDIMPFIHVVLGKCTP